MKLIFTILAGLLLSVSTSSQTRVLYGKLTVFNTFPVQNVAVTSKKAKSTTKSDSLGHFAIVCLEKDVIKIKPQAFESVSKNVNSKTESLNINLIFIDSRKNREIAIGYGYIDEQSLNYAVAHLQSHNNDFCSFTNVYDLIRGKFSGVNVSQNSVFVRGGNTSFTPGASEVLYIVDGQPVSSIDWISPCEISTIDILIDSQAAIYGSRGGNGVLIITTRTE